MLPVKPKKSLGQHFLTDKNIARKIVDSLTWQNYHRLLEIGPGMGILTGLLVEMSGKDLRFVEIDNSSVEFLRDRYPSNAHQVIAGDILTLDWKEVFGDTFAIIGNFPYNISSPIFFRILENRNLIAETVCMIQKEVALRIASPPGSKNYGILSVLLQAYFDIEYLFTVPPQVFNPPPRVSSAVIRLRRNMVQDLGCREEAFVKVVKTSFNQRRKILRNSLRSLSWEMDDTDPIWQKRPEQLSVNDFVRLTRLLEQKPNAA